SHAPPRLPAALTMRSTVSSSTAGGWPEPAPPGSAAKRNPQTVQVRYSTPSFRNATVVAPPHTLQTGLDMAGERSLARLRARHQDVLEELARAPPGAPVDVPPAALLQLEAGALEDLLVQPARVVDDHHHRRARPQRRAGVAEHRRHVGHVGLERRPARPLRGGADLHRAQVGQVEQLERVAVLLVVVDPPG